MTDLSAIGRYARMARFYRNTRSLMRRHRVRCYATMPFSEFHDLRCFGSIWHRGEHSF